MSLMTNLKTLNNPTNQLSHTLALIVPYRSSSRSLTRTLEWLLF